MNIFIVQTMVMLALAIVMFYLIIYNKSLKLERRIARYSIESIKDKPVSFLDFLSISYSKMIKNTSKSLKKSRLATKYSQNYVKYISYENEKDIVPMDYISNKLFISLAFILITCFARVIESKMPSIFDILFVGIIGFFIIDVWFLISDYLKRKRIEQELLNAIIIMNNAFRSGRSTMQAIEIVANELTGPIQEEFKKMHLEISYGLSLDTVFERFSKRVNLEEVNYITSSLTILNKTGGNIINVFSSIEKMLFNKKKIKEEMRSLTSSSKMVSKILLIMPILFVVIIFILNQSYFTPLLTTTIGKILLFTMILIYGFYAFIVNKIMRVRV